MSGIKYEFLMSQINVLRDIKENDKTKISIVFYEGSQSTCILRVCKNRDLSVVCNALMEIKHPNIEVVYDYVYNNGNTYIIEEHISGRTLEQIISEDGILSEREASKILANVCEGLDVLHGHQPPVVHNDINTSNIMIRDDGSVKLFDFDIARTYKNGVGKNTTLFGTEEYASPEHFGYGQSEPRTDIYSLGVTLHKMLAGKSLTKEHKIVYEGRLKKVIQKCIQVDPEKRYSSVMQLKKDLDKNQQRVVVLLNKVFVAMFAVMAVVIVVLVVSMGNSNNSNNSNNSSSAFIADNDSKVSDEEGDSEAAETTEQTAENSTTDDTAQNTEQTTQGTATEKRVKNVQVLECELRSMAVLGDGTYVWLTRPDDQYYYIMTSKGEKKVIEELSDSYGMKLAYNSDTDKLYLICHFYNSRYSEIYVFNDDYSVSELAKLKKGDKDTLWKQAKVHFFEDGTMFCDVLENELIDSSTWSEIGNADVDVDAVIGERMYDIKWNSDTYKYTIAEIDSANNIINEYQISDNDYSYSIEDNAIYSTNKYLYFIATVMDKEYLHRFDGSSCEVIACLNDYKYYSPVTCEALCVTDDMMWIYDEATQTIKEFDLK